MLFLKEASSLRSYSYELDRTDRKQATGQARPIYGGWGSAVVNGVGGAGITVQTICCFVVRCCFQPAFPFPAESSTRLADEEEKTALKRCPVVVCESRRRAEEAAALFYYKATQCNVGLLFSYALSLPLCLFSLCAVRFFAPCSLSSSGEVMTLLNGGEGGKSKRRTIFAALLQWPMIGCFGFIAFFSLYFYIIRHG